MPPTPQLTEDEKTKPKYVDDKSPTIAQSKWTPIRRSTEPLSSSFHRLYTYNIYINIKDAACVLQTEAALGKLAARSR